MPRTLISLTLIIPTLLLASPVTAQLPAPPQPLDVVLYSDTLLWEAIPDTQVQAELVGASGPRATASDVAGPDGRVRLWLWPVGGAFPGDVVIEPGDSLRLARYGQSAITVTVPDLGAEIDPVADRISGTAPADGAVELELHHGLDAAQTLTRTLVADADGRFTAELAGVADLAPGDYGWVRYRSPEGHRFTAPFAALALDVTVGADRIRGRGTPGARLEAVVVDAAGTEKGRAALRVTGGMDWTIPDRWGYWTVPSIAAGDSVRLTSTAGPGAAPRTLSVTVPELELTLNRGNQTVSGRGPAGAALMVEAWPPEGEPIREPVTADAAGGFKVDLAGRATLDPGWRVAAIHATAPGVRTRAIAAVRRIDIGLHGNRVGGMLDPGRPVTATLHSAAGLLKARSWGAKGDDLGLFQAEFWGQVAVDIEPGDRVEIELTTGDPIEIVVPALTARADPVADTISGEASPGALVRVMGGPGPGAAVKTVRADDQGRYRADFAGEVDIAPPLWGHASIEPMAGFRVTTDWSAVRMTLSGFERLGGTGLVYLAGNGPPDRRVNARLRAPDGTVVASAEDRTYRSSADEREVLVGPGGTVDVVDAPRWFVWFHDETGTEVPAEPGDIVEATVGDDTLRFTVPPLDGVVFVGDDRISGHTDPGLALTLRARRAFGAESASATLTAGADGVFDHAFGADFDVQYNDAVVVTAEVGGHAVSRALTVPGLRLDLDTATLDGSSTPDASIEIEVRGSSGLRTVAIVFTHGDATFSVQLVGPDGAPLDLEPGDVITVRPGGGPAGEALTLAVPELTIDSDTATDRVHGRATPGGSLALRASQVFEGFGGFGGGGIALATIAADGVYGADFVPAYDVRAGTRIAAEYRLPSGHLVTRSDIVPVLSAQHGGAEVCGYAPRGAALSLRLVDVDGATAASATSQAGDDGWFTATLRDNAGQPVASRARQALMAIIPLEGGTPLASVLVLPRFDLELNWDNRLGDGEGPPNTDYSATFPSTGCDRHANWRLAFGGFTDDDGAFSVWLDDYVPGEGFDVAFYPASGHRIHRTFFEPHAEIYLRTARVAGRAPALASLAVVLADAAGTERGRAAAQVGSDSRYDVRLNDPGGRRALIQPGDVVRLALDGGAGGSQTSVEIPVEPLDFDYDAGREISVVGPPDRDVRVVLTVAAGKTYTFERSLDASGGLKFTPADVPPRANWSLADVTRVRIELPVAGGHVIVAETPPPVEPGGAVYLPALVNRVELGTGDRAAILLPAPPPPDIAPVFRLRAAPRPGTRSDPAPPSAASGAARRAIRRWR